MELALFFGVLFLLLILSAPIGVCLSFYQFLSLFIPLLMHGFYDFAATSTGNSLSMIFFTYIIVMDIIAYVMVLRISKNDTRLREHDINHLS